MLGLGFAFISFGLYKLFEHKIIKLSKLEKDPIMHQSANENLLLQLDEIVEKENAHAFDLNKIKSYKHILYYGTESEKIDFIGMVVYNPSSEFVNLSANCPER